VRQAAATKQETCRPIGRFVMFHTFRDLRRDHSTSRPLYRRATEVEASAASQRAAEVTRRENSH